MGVYGIRKGDPKWHDRSVPDHINRVAEEYGYTKVDNYSTNGSHNRWTKSTRSGGKMAVDFWMNKGTCKWTHTKPGARTKEKMMRETNFAKLRKIFSWT